MRTAVLSDIHANSEALRAVLAEIDAVGVDEIVCLGDVIGYGPDPLTCIDLVQDRCALCLLGNHDFACRTHPVNFNQAAREAALWTRFKLDTPWPDETARQRRIEYLDHLPVRIRYAADPRLLCVHGSSRCATNEYVFPDDLEDLAKFDRLFERFDHVCLEGHTHMPVVFEQQLRIDEDGSEHTSYQRFVGYREESRAPGPDGTGTIRGASSVRLRLGDGHKYIINPGSVGQPRDRDPWASWAIIELPGEGDPTVSFHRTYYDWHRVLDMIRRTEHDDHCPYQLDEFLGTRLERGY